MKRLAVLALSALAMAAAPATRAAAAEAPEGQLLPPLPPRKLMTEVGAPVPPPRLFRSGFQVETASGYKVGVSTFGSAVILVVSRGDRKHLSESIYLARGVATPDRLQATFGQLGKVAMRFREASRHSLCHGLLRLTRHKGVFVGSLRFRGENGYVSVHLHRAGGGILEPAGRCPRRPRRHHGSSGGPIFFTSIAALLAESREGVDTTGLLALEFGRASGVLAVHEESRGKLSVIRTAFAYTRPAFRANEAVTAARISPPAPFHGGGRYHAAADGTYTWTGDLSVNFPGAPRFPLTGPQYKVFLEVPF
jgi:hypothetical protein